MMLAYIFFAFATASGQLKSSSPNFICVDPVISVGGLVERIRFVIQGAMAKISCRFFTGWVTGRYGKFVTGVPELWSGTGLK